MALASGFLYFVYSGMACAVKINIIIINIDKMSALYIHLMAVMRVRNNETFLRVESSLFQANRNPG